MDLWPWPHLPPCCVSLQLSPSLCYLQPLSLTTPLETVPFPPTPFPHCASNSDLSYISFREDLAAKEVALHGWSAMTLSRSLAHMHLSKPPEVHVLVKSLPLHFVLPLPPIYSVATCVSTAIEFSATCVVLRK